MMASLHLVASLGFLSLLHGATAFPHLTRAVNSSSSWKTLRDLPQLRQDHSTVAIDDYTIAVVGGTTPITENDVVTGIETVDWLHLYDVSSDSWTDGAPLPKKINNPNAASVDGKLYLLGGLVDANSPPDPSANWVATGESFVYDAAADEWTELEPIPEGREKGSAVVGVWNEMIYLVGGMTALDPEFQDAVTSAIAFNTTSGDWQQLERWAESIPSNRQHAAGGVVGSTMYVIGGRYFAQENIRNTVYSLDLAKPDAVWETVSNVMPTARGGICSAVVDNKIYVFGGEANENDEYGIFDNVEAFDTETQEWTSLDPMALPRHGTSAVAIGDKIYIPGGSLLENGLPGPDKDGVEQILMTSAHLDVFTPLG